MEFSVSFLFHFGLSLVAFQFLGIALCRGSWRNMLRKPFEMAIIFFVLSHMRVPSTTYFIAPLLAVLVMAITIWRAHKGINYEPAIVRDGHNFLGILAGAALFGITTQLHNAIIGVPIFQLVK